MPEPKFFLGFDPGGVTLKKRRKDQSPPGPPPYFGVAALVLGPPTRCVAARVNSVAAAVRWAAEHCPVTPAGAGIDTLLTWEDGENGWRGQDIWLRNNYREFRERVASPNSLLGAMSIQGPVLAMRLRERWPGLPITETHPKMLESVLGSDAPDSLRSAIEFVSRNKDESRNEDEKDAVISAWVAAKASLTSRTRDLNAEGRNLIRPVPSTTYLWPDAATAWCD